MKIKLAQESGFCFGVKKALDRISSIKHKKEACVLGKLIHNPQVIEELKKEGIRFTDSVEDVSKGALIISAHGTSDRNIEKAKEKRLDIIDTTCPLVRNVHNITKDLEKKGYRIIIFGDKEHTEVKGIMGNLNNTIIISEASELDSLKEGKYALVSQTTQDIARFDEISLSLKDKFKDALVKDTICSATKSRQESAARIAKESNLMIVIGGYNSANTKRLADICSRITETKHIEKAEEIRKEWFISKENIGVTAGASTPQDVIKDVVEAIQNIKITV